LASRQVSRVKNLVAAFAGWRKVKADWLGSVCAAAQALASKGRLRIALARQGWRRRCWKSGLATAAVLILTNAFAKKSQKTPRQEIELAISQVARDAGVSRESLYKALSGERIPVRRGNFGVVDWRETLVDDGHFGRFSANVLVKSAQVARPRPTVDQPDRTADIFHGVNSKFAHRTCPKSIWRVASRKLDQLDSAE